MISRMQYVVSTRVRSGLVHGLSWTGLAAPTTPWQRATVSKLIAILDTRQWSVAIQDCETVGGSLQLRLPIPLLLIQSMHHYELAIPQLIPNGMRVFLDLIVIADEAGIVFFGRRFSCTLLSSRKFQGLWSILDVSKEEETGGRKDLRKPLLKALLFEEKLERLLAQPNREGALRRLFSTLLFIEPLFDEEVLIAELALDMMNIEFPSPKELLTRKKAAKVAAAATAASRVSV
ncbi:hypothetical protein TIFTF001_043361 [Ficus carica]|uniref:Uncharacterized protein n=1 Tax=Ficus carica TaxID=3494 RepID=A0AA87ZBM4_FICCA|nr:hypothetical protein TIFTF001_043361 [Ficus carica]